MQKRKCAVNEQIFRFLYLFGRASSLSQKPKMLRLPYYVGKLFLTKTNFNKFLLNAYQAYIKVIDDNKYLLVEFKMLCISSKQAINMAALLYSTNSNIDN